jgi:uncharacterized membrane protein YdbT with pleckstrin-like domain
VEAGQDQEVVMFEVKDFAGRQEDEPVELFVRSHPLYLAWRLLLPALLTIGAIALGIVGLNAFPQAGAGVIFLGLWVVFVPMLWVAWRFALWYNDYFIITDRRVIDHVSKPFIYKKRNETQLGRIQDAQVVFPNTVGVLLNFGHVVVQTAGMTGQLDFRYASRPNRLQDKLMNLVMQQQQPSPAAGPLDQLAGALRDSLIAQQPEEVSGEQLSTPTSQGAQQGASQPSTSELRSRSLHDLVLFRPAPDAVNPQTWRKHWVVLVQAAYRPLLAIGLMAAILFLVPHPTVRMIAIPLLIIGFLYLAWQIADWFNDVYVITEDRIIDVEKVPFVSEDRREARLSMIQDINYSQPNLASRILNYGDVVVQTAGRSGAFTFDRVARPKQVQREIFARWERARLAQRPPSDADTAKDVVELLNQYYEAKQNRPAPPP